MLPNNQITKMKRRHESERDNKELYELIKRKCWDDALELFQPSHIGSLHEKNEQLLRRRLGSQEKYLTFEAVISKTQGKLCPSALSLCMKLIDVGGIDMLKSRGRNDNDYDYRYGSALHYILLFDVVCLEIFNRIVEVGGIELLLMVDRKSWTVLHHVVESGRTRWPRLDMIDKLLEIGGAELVLITDDYEHTALHHALGLGCFQFDGMSPSLDIVNRLLAVGGRQLVMTSDSGLRQTVLHRICLNKRAQPNLEVVDRLLAVGGEPLIFMRDVHGNTLLHLACFRSVLRDNDVRLIERLIERGRKKLLLMTDDVNRTAMQIQLEMSFNSSQEIIDRFVEVGGEELFLVRKRTAAGRNIF